MSYGNLLLCTYGVAFAERSETLRRERGRETFSQLAFGTIAREEERKNGERRKASKYARSSYVILLRATMILASISKQTIRSRKKFSIDVRFDIRSILYIYIYKLIYKLIKLFLYRKCIMFQII